MEQADLKNLPPEVLDLPVTCRCPLAAADRKCAFRCVLQHLSAVERMRKADIKMAIAMLAARGDAALEHALKKKLIWGLDYDAGHPADPISGQRLARADQRARHLSRRWLRPTRRPGRNR
jgi:hypothetical protein